MAVWILITYLTTQLLQGLTNDICPRNWIRLLSYTCGWQCLCAYQNINRLWLAAKLFLKLSIFSHIQIPKTNIVDIYSMPLKLCSAKYCSETNRYCCITGTQNDLGTEFNHTNSSHSPTTICAEVISLYAWHVPIDVAWVLVVRITWLLGRTSLELGHGWIITFQWPLLLTWFNFNPKMDN